MSLHLDVRGDVVTDASLTELMVEHGRNDPLATLAVYASSEIEGKGVCVVGADGQITAFVEKPDSASQSALINAGLDRHTLMRGPVEFTVGGSFSRLASP